VTTTAERLSAIDRPVPTGINHDRHRKRERWTPEDDGIVRREYKGTWQDCERIALLLGRSYNSINSRIGMLGLTRPKPADWSSEEDAFLSQHAAKHGPKWLSQHLPGRSPTAVKVRLKRLHIRLRDRDFYTKAEACHILGVDHKWLQRAIDRGELKARPHIEGRPTQSGGAYWHIEPADLRSFVLSHLTSLTGRNIDLVLLVDLLGVRSA
jgi:hypothetical protein